MPSIPLAFASSIPASEQSKSGKIYPHTSFSRVAIASYTSRSAIARLIITSDLFALMNEPRRPLRESEKRASSALQPQGVSQGMGVGKRPSNGVSAAIFDSTLGVGSSMFWLPRKPRQAIVKYNLERRRN